MPFTTTNTYRRYGKVQNMTRVILLLHRKKCCKFLSGNRDEGFKYLKADPNRIGWIFSTLSHHRTCRSAYGGSNQLQHVPFGIIIGQTD